MTFRTGAFAYYLAMIDSLDQNIGRLIETLEDKGSKRQHCGVFPQRQRKRTEGNRQQRSHYEAIKRTLYEGGIRVPFLASWPAQWPQGIIYEPMVSSMDLAPTILEPSRHPRKSTQDRPT